MVHPPLLVFGAGNMGRAITVGGLGAAALDANRVAVVEPVAEQREGFRVAISTAGCGEVTVSANAGEGMAWLQLHEREAGLKGQILLALKPQMLEGLGAELGQSGRDTVG